ncbi:MAG: pyrroloquinoline quinone biosynthesis protein PqqB [Gammaproteobacteria bacterium]|nr:pyrroloquinoline quinone biosynthesis protein PqqB [Gammaproteobacteria bacterium]
MLCTLLLVISARMIFADVSPYIYVLGISQDAGYPQAGCYRAHCMPAWTEPANKRLATSLAVVDGQHRTKYLFEATPDMPEQLFRLHSVAPDETYALGGVFLTHAHIGHYTGLMHFGREAIGAQEVPVYAMPKMRKFLSSNGPWDQLVRLRNVLLQPLAADEAITLSPQLVVTPLLVPHRDEYSETVAYLIRGPAKSALFVPDINKWEVWDKDIRELVRRVDYALLDATFFAAGEIPGRNMEDIPHPFVDESLKLFGDLDDAEKHRIIFIHFNHTNPLLIDGSAAQRKVQSLGFRIATEGMRLEL